MRVLYLLGKKEGFVVQVILYKLKRVVSIVPDIQFIQQQKKIEVLKLLLYKYE
jgi:hypothetical protein